MEELSSWMGRKLSLRPSKYKLRQKSPHVVDTVAPDYQRGETVTLLLPPEILLSIFDYLDRDSRILVRASSVCARWRAVAVQTPYFWTKINVTFNHYYTGDLSRARFVLGIFLARTEALPLDVEIHGLEGSASLYERDELTLFHDVFRQKGPFHRWRSLLMDVGSFWSSRLAEFEEVDAFSGLEHLIIERHPPPAYLNRLNRTVTSKLHTLEIRTGYPAPALPAHLFRAAYRPILERVDNLILGINVELPAGALSPNVATLQVHNLPNFPIPHVKHLDVRVLNMDLFTSLSPVHLVTLFIHLSVHDFSSVVRVDLPNLLWLTLRAKTFIILSALNAPRLQTLSLESPAHEEQATNGPLVTALRGLQVDKLQILFLDVRLDWEATIQVLLFFPDISCLDLHCHTAQEAEIILSHVVGEDNHNLCPFMDVIRIILDCQPDSPYIWKQYLSWEASKIGDSLRRLESRWPGGSYFIESTTRPQKEIKEIYPWRTLGYHQVV